MNSTSDHQTKEYDTQQLAVLAAYKAALTQESEAIDNPDDLHQVAFFLRGPELGFKTVNLLKAWFYRKFAAQLKEEILASLQKVRLEKPPTIKIKSRNPSAPNGYVREVLVAEVISAFEQYQTFAEVAVALDATLYELQTVWLTPVIRSAWRAKHPLNRPVSVQAIIDHLVEKADLFVYPIREKKRNETNILKWTTAVSAQLEEWKRLWREKYPPQENVPGPSTLVPRRDSTSVSSLVRIHRGWKKGQPVM